MLLDKLLPGLPSREQREITGKSIPPKSLGRTFAAENQTPDEMLNAGANTVVYLLEHQYIDQDLAEELLSRMLIAYVSSTVALQLEDAIIDAVDLSLSEFRRGNNG